MPARPQPAFYAGMYSCLAGFVERGETIENAVRRETLEESGIRIGRVRYHASQPWPLPPFVMIGCYAEAKSTALSATNRNWKTSLFTRAETEAMLERATGVATPETSTFRRRRAPLRPAHARLSAWRRAQLRCDVLNARKQPCV